MAIDDLYASAALGKIADALSNTDFNGAKLYLAILDSGLNINVSDDAKEKLNWLFDQTCDGCGAALLIHGTPEDYDYDDTCDNPECITNGYETP